MRNAKQGCRGAFKLGNLLRPESVGQPSCKYLHTFSVPFYSSPGMFSTCRLIPLLTAGRQVNRALPPGDGWGVHLDGTPLGGSCSGRRHARGNDILSSPKPAASGCLNLPAADWTRSIPHSPAGPVFVNATRLKTQNITLRQINGPVLGSALLHATSQEYADPYQSDCLPHCQVSLSVSL